MHLDNIKRKFKSKNKPPAGLHPHSGADGKLVNGPGHYGSLCDLKVQDTHHVLNEVEAETL